MTEEPTQQNPVLAQITISTPCQMDWDLMTGDDQVRFCRRCQKNVFNFAAMSESAALDLLQSKTDVCARIFRRPDGTIVTQACPPPLPPVSAGKNRFQFSLMALLVLMTTSAGLSASAPWIGQKVRPLWDRLTRKSPPTNIMPLMGDVAMPIAPVQNGTGATKMLGKIAPSPTVE